MTLYHVYRMLRFWALAGIPSWGILALVKYLGGFGDHAFDFSSYLGLGYIILWTLSWFTIGRDTAITITIPERKPE